MRRVVAGSLVVLGALAAVALGSPASARAAGPASVDSYLRQVAGELPQPGVYVDPGVLASGRLTPRDVATLRTEVRKARSAVHLWVLPASRLSTGQGLAATPRAFIARLHRLVGRPGTYALLTAAPTRAAGQAFYAYQWAGDGPVFRTGRAARDAIDCCAPDYAAVLTRFVRESDVRRAGGTSPSKQPRQRLFFEPDPTPGGSSPVTGFAIVAVVVVAGVGGVLTLNRRTGSAVPGAPPVDVAELRVPLAQEIEEVRQQIGAADAAAATTAPEVAQRIAAARSALDSAHARLTGMASPADAQAVTGALADARYELSAAEALRSGRSVPDRTPPCFVDPRHGPSTTTHVYPPSGLVTPVPVCAACNGALSAGTPPPARPLLLGGSTHYAWSAYGPAWCYLMGYWPQQQFLMQLPHHAGFMSGDAAHHHNPGPSGGGGGFFGGGGGFGGGGHHGGGGFGGGGFGGGGHDGGGGFGGGHGGGGGFGGGGHGGGGGGGGGHHG